MTLKWLGGLFHVLEASGAVPQYSNSFGLFKKNKSSLVPTPPRNFLFACSRANHLTSAGNMETKSDVSQANQ